MAITFVEATAQGKDAFAALKSGQLIESFTYSLQEAPEILKKLIYGYNDPLYKQIMLEASIAHGSTSSDQDRWYEAGRSQNSYERTVEWDTVPLAGATGILQFPAGKNFDIRKDQTIMLGALAADITGVADILEEFFVLSVDTTLKQASVQSREGGTSNFVVANTALVEVMSVNHIASDHKQGSSVADESVTHEGTWISNKPIIIKDYQKYDRSKIQQMVTFSDDMTRYDIDTRAMDIRFQTAQVLALIFGRESQAGALKTSGILGAESLVEGVKARGNTASGTWAAKSDLDNLVKMLDSVKGSKKNKLMLDINKRFELDTALANVTQYDPNTFNYGEFNEGVDYRKLGFDGFMLSGSWDFVASTWNILSDRTYFGVHLNNSNSVKGLLIPDGSVDTYDGGSVPYLTFRYRDGKEVTIGKNGNVFGLGHSDTASISYTTEITLAGANLKDFVLFT